jgi:hypothetical protein
MVPKDKHIQRKKSKCLKRKLRKEKNMTKPFQDFKKEYLEELGSEAKEKYNKALEELKEEKQK